MPAPSCAIEPATMRRLGQARKTELTVIHTVMDGQAGLLFVDGAYVRTLGAGVHGFWAVGHMVQMKVVDLKRQSLDVAGQEVLTKDRVTIRVNIAAEYRVVDPLKAVSAVKDFSEALYRALQYAFRKTLSSLTLDQILEKKVTVDEEAAAKVRTDMAEIGVEVSDISLKDVILPGEMREILNQVVSATKQAEANIIRRREETNATRSLLNTAKVMAENPVMLRLKELEALRSHRRQGRAADRPQRDRRAAQRPRQAPRQLIASRKQEGRHADMAALVACKAAAAAWETFALFLPGKTD